MRKLILAAMVTAGMFLASGTAEACHRRCTPVYYTCECPVCVTYYQYTEYHIWHVYQTNPVTGEANIVNRYLTREAADADPLVTQKKAYVIEYLYYAA